MRLMRGIYYQKGATAFEGQIGRLVFRWTHLEGKHWRWKPWRRVKIQWERGYD